MNAVGIDVSKGKSTVTIRRPGDVVLMPPCDIPHTQSAINDLITFIQSLDGETKVCMEHTGRYYEPVATWLSDADIFVSAVNILSSGTSATILYALPRLTRLIPKKLLVIPLTVGQN